jgi:molybdopterin molybdotransferase
MISLAEAQAFVLAWCSPLAPLPMPLDEALGCVAAEIVRASEPVPPFANSSMDGYAVRAVDTAGACGWWGPSWPDRPAISRSAQGRRSAS